MVKALCYQCLTWKEGNCKEVNDIEENEYCPNYQSSPYLMASSRYFRKKTHETVSKSKSKKSRIPEALLERYVCYE